MKILYLSALFILLLACFLYFFNQGNKDEVTTDSNPLYSITKQNSATRISHQVLSDIASMKNSENELKQHMQLLLKEISQLNNKINAIEKRLDTNPVAAVTNHLTPVSYPLKNPTKSSNLTYSEAFDAALYNEETDNDWALQAQNQIENALSSLQNEVPEVTILENTCYSTLCKVSYELPHTDNLQHHISKISNELVWEAKSFSQYKISETGEVIVSGYYMRENHDYPESVLALRDMDKAPDN
ncbi:MAG: hypothetical protein AAGB12_08230 [Pseudomonadota bacterium]